jgi:hypothetical protein
MALEYSHRFITIDVQMAVEFLLSRLTSVTPALVKRKTILGME